MSEISCIQVPLEVPPQNLPASEITTDQSKANLDSVWCLILRDRKTSITRQTECPEDEAECTIDH